MSQANGLLLKSVLIHSTASAETADKVKPELSTGGYRPFSFPIEITGTKVMNILCNSHPGSTDDPQPTHQATSSHDRVHVYRSSAVLAAMALNSVPQGAEATVLHLQ